MSKVPCCLSEAVEAKQGKEAEDHQPQTGCQAERSANGTASSRFICYVKVYRFELTVLQQVSDFGCRLVDFVTVTMQACDTDARHMRAWRVHDDDG